MLTFALKYPPPATAFEIVPPFIVTFAVVTVEDLYGSTEIIAVDSCYARDMVNIVEDNIILVEGRLSVREDEEPKIVANRIISLSKEVQEETKQKNTPKILNLEITNATEEQKEKLRGAIRFFAGEKNNILVQVVENGITKPCGAIYLTEDILKEFYDILGKENVKIL